MIQSSCKRWNTTAETPFVLYISGDGGFNTFSTALCNAISKEGYSITAVNAKSYFWEKNTGTNSKRYN
jgi:type IV secretory pathway VirJ component